MQIVKNEEKMDKINKNILYLKKSNFFVNSLEFLSELWCPSQDARRLTSGSEALQHLTQNSPENRKRKREEQKKYGGNKQRIQKRRIEEMQKRKNRIDIDRNIDRINIDRRIEEKRTSGQSAPVRSPTTSAASPARATKWSLDRVLTPGP